MRKEKLSQMKKLLVTKKMSKLVEEDKGEEKRTLYSKRTTTVYKCYRFYRAAVEDGILKIALFSRKSISEGNEEADFYIFIDKGKNEWITYVTNEDRWSKAMLGNLMHIRENGEVFQSFEWISLKENKIICDYIGKKNDGISAIRQYQAEVKEIALRQAYKKETDKIDEVMKKVPELPKGFDKWAEKKAFKNDSYMIMKPGKVEKAYCTYCEKMVPISKTKKPRHNDCGKCPKCRAKVTYKSYGRQDGINDSKNVGIIQKIEEERYILRIFNVRKSYEQYKEYKNPEVSIKEWARFELNRNFSAVEEYMYMEYKRTGIVRWCYAVRRGYMDYGPSTYCALYDRNIDAILKETDARYVPLGKLLRMYQGEMLYADYALNFCTRKESIEKIIKVGLYDMAWDYISSYRVPDDEIKWKENKVNNMLMLSKQYLRLAIKMKARKKDLYILQAASFLGIDLKEKTIKTLNRFYGYSRIDDNMILLLRGNIEKMANYLLRIKEKNEYLTDCVIGRDYNDYLEQLGKLRIPINKSTRFPANFYETHNALSEQIREQEKELEKKNIEQKNVILKEIVEELKKLYYLKSSKYIIVWPEGKADFQREGQLQHNCVSGYFDKMVKRNTVVFFLRNKENQEEPFCTVEFKDERCLQCRTKYNHEAPKEAMEMMDIISRNYRKESRRREEDGSSNIRQAVFAV